MRIILYTIGALMVAFVGVWCYDVTNKTREASQRVVKLQKEIVEQQEALAKLRSEWAYLNRPDRLRSLVDLNFEHLQLVPLSAPHFAKLADLPQPRASQFDKVELPQSLRQGDDQ